MVRPAYVVNVWDQDERQVRYNYMGGVQCYGELGKIVYEQNRETDHRTFRNKVHGCAIIPLKDGGTYWGAVTPNPSDVYEEKGWLCWHGLGCLEKSNGDWYLGEFALDQRDGAVLCNEGGVISLRSYERGKIIGGEFIMRENELVIAPRGDMTEYLTIDYRYLTVKLTKNGKTETVADFQAYTADRQKFNPMDGVSPEERSCLALAGLEYRVDHDYNIWVTGEANPGKRVKLHIPSCVYGIDPKAFRGSKNIQELVIQDGVAVISDSAFAGCKNLTHITLPNTVEVIERNSFDGTGPKVVAFPKSVNLIKTGAFFTCKKLEGVSIGNAKCVVEKDAFPKGCKIYNAGQVKEELEMLKKEREENVAKIVKELREKKTKKKDRPKEQKPKKVREVKERYGGGILSVLAGIFGAILSAILFIPGLILKLIKKMFRMPERCELSHVICAAVAIVGAATLILGHFNLLGGIEDAFSVFANETVPGLFGFRLTAAYSELVNSVMASNGFLGVILTILYVVVAPFNLLLNGVVLVLVIVTYLVYAVWGILYIYGFGALMVAPTIFALIKGENKSVPIWTLIIGIAISVIYYLNFNAYYPV